MEGDRNKKIAINTVLLSVRMVVLLVISLYTSRVFLDVLGVEDYGIVNVVAGFVSMFMFLNQALTNCIQRFYNFELGANGESSLQKVYSTSIFIQFILAIIIIMLLESIGLWYMYNKMVIPTERLASAIWLFQFSVASAVLVIFSAPYTAAVITYERMDYFAFVNILDALLKLCFALLLPYLNPDKIVLYGFFFFLTAVIDFLLYYIYVKRKFKVFKFDMHFNKALFYKMISFSGWGVTGSMACVVREQGLNMILNLFFGPVVNAARGIAYQVSSALQGLVQNLYTAASPQMMQSYASGEGSRTIRLMTTMSKLNFAFLFILAVPIVLEIDYILRIWLGKNVPDFSNIFIFWIILTNFVNNLNAPISNVVFATGKIKKYELAFSSFNLAILPISYLALSMCAPPVSVFIVYFILMIITQTACLYILRSLMSFSIRQYCVRLILPLIVSSFICVIIPVYIHYHIDESFIRLLLVGLSTIIVSIPVFYLMVMDTTEKGYITNAFQSFLNRLGYWKK